MQENYFTLRTYRLNNHNLDLENNTQGERTKKNVKVKGKLRPRTGHESTEGD